MRGDREGSIALTQYIIIIINHYERDEGRGKCYNDPVHYYYVLNHYEREEGSAALTSTHYYY